MVDKLLVWLTVVLLVTLICTLAVRSVAVERAAGTSARFVRPPLVRRMDLAAVCLAVLLLAATVLRVVNTVV